jgi:hypothetical protein
MELTQDLLERFKSIKTHFETKEEAKKAEEKREQEENQRLIDLAINEFKSIFEEAVSKKVIDQLGVEYSFDQSTPTNGWILRHSGELAGTRVPGLPHTKVRLSDGHWIKVWCNPIKPNSYTRIQWMIRYPLLPSRDSQEYETSPCKSEVASIEDCLIWFCCETEQKLQLFREEQAELERIRAAEAAEKEREELEKEQLCREVEAESAEIKGLIQQAITPYAPQWPEGFVLYVYKWRYCTGAANGKFDYAEVYTLAAQADCEDQAILITPLEGDRLLLYAEIHKPVISEIVIDSLESAKRLGKLAFYFPPDLIVKGVFEDVVGELRKLVWQWGDEENSSNHPWGQQLKPWLRSLLKLPELPTKIVISKTQN